MYAAREAIGLLPRETSRLFAVFVPVLGLLLAVDVGFVAVNAASLLVIDGVHDVWYLGAEMNLPTWWSSAKLLLTGLCFCAVTLRLAGASSLWMALLGVVFVAMSADEIASLHERVGNLLDGGTRSETAFHHTGLWFVVVGVPFIVLMGFVLWKLWAALAAVRGTRARLILGIAVLLAGALAIEGLGNFTIPAKGLGDDALARRLYLLSVIAEEGLEMVGSSVLLWGALIFMIHHPSLPGLAELARPRSRE